MSDRAPDPPHDPADIEPPELSRPVPVRALPRQTVEITASAAECAALAARFDVPAVKRLSAKLDVVAEGDGVVVDGTMSAAIVQDCAVAHEPFDTAVEEAVSLRFVPETRATPSDAEYELSADELDEIAYAGDTIDLGEAVAQTLGLAIDPYATSPQADGARKAAGLSDEDTPRGPLADALAALKKN